MPRPEGGTSLPTRDYSELYALGKDKIAGGLRIENLYFHSFIRY
jgi:hypothetical protein